GTNESIEKPGGTVSTTWVVVTPSFSVGTARLYSCSCFDNDTSGLIRACAHAFVAANSAPAANAPTSRVFLPLTSPPCRRCLTGGRARQRGYARRSGGPRLASRSASTFVRAAREKATGKRNELGSSRACG